jgi:hypothetical protein
MPCSGFGSYGLVNKNFFTSLNYYAGQGQNLLVLAYLAWNEKKYRLCLCLHFLRIYPLWFVFKHKKVFFIKPWLGSHSTLGNKNKIWANYRNAHMDLWKLEPNNIGHHHIKGRTRERKQENKKKG